MKFGSVPLSAAEGAVLAHSMRTAEGSVKKGTVLTEAHLQRLSAAGVQEVVAAQIGPGDVPEDEAAARIAHALAPAPEAAGLSASAPFTGRANLFAAQSGVLRVDEAVIAALNAIDESVTLATLPNHARTRPPHDDGDGEDHPLRRA